ncbi:MAG TPA: bacillithiol biosynthesis BshC, partial [Terriglobales bacterium]
STLVFALREGARIPVHRRVKAGTQFLIGDETIDRPDLLRRIAALPHEFSANVLLRPVVQDYLLPTLAYTGGAAEVAYFAQAAVAYQTFLGRVTPVIPRFSATIIEPKYQALLKRYGLSFTDVLRGPEWLRQQLAAQTLPQQLQAAFEGALVSLEKSLATIRESLEGLDKTLVEAADNAGSKMRHQLQTLQDRAVRAQLRQSEVLERHARLLSNALYPDKTLQEREVGGMYFVGRQGKEILQELYEFIHTECLDHQVISI